MTNNDDGLEKDAASQRKWKRCKTEKESRMTFVLAVLNMMS